MTTYVSKIISKFDSEYTYIERTNDDGTVDMIPTDPANSDYQRYLRWLENPDAEEGGTL